MKFESHDIVFEILFLGFDGVSQRSRFRVNDLTQRSTLRCSIFYSFLTFIYDVPAWVIPIVLSRSIFESLVMIIQGKF